MVVGTARSEAGYGWRSAYRGARAVLHIHRAERADGLVEALAALLADPLEDPFANEVVAVPTRGMERWLTQRVSARLGVTPGRADGVCANVAFPSPRRLTGDAVAAASGIDPDTDPWLAERLFWPLLTVVDEALAEPWLSVLAAHLGADGDATDLARRARRLSAVRHVAELFDRYAVHRPEMLGQWATGHDSGAGGEPLPDDARWQAALWRRLRDRLAVPDPAARLAAGCERLRADRQLAALPPRLSLFGLTRLPAASLQVLAALAAHRDVHLFALHPSPALWRRVQEAVRDDPPVLRRATDPTATLPANRLLASWGQDARELQLVLRRCGEPGAEHHHRAEHAATLLRSIQVHACHGRGRQVEVLHGAILHLLDEDPTLEPRDVIVMCPDIETFAPLIQATFGAGQVGEEVEPLPEGVRPPDLRVRLADRSLRQTNPILGVVSALLELAGGRVTASDVLDLADRPPVRRRFGFDDDALSRIEEWVADSGIRWGLDAGHRAPFRLQELEAGTWRAGLDRLLLGVTMGEAQARLVGGVLALDDVDSGAIELAGRLAELVDRLGAALDALSAPQPIDGWASGIGAAADALTATTPSEAWERAELGRLLQGVVEGATSGDGTVSAVALELPEVRALLAARLAGRPTRANFRTGHLTVCTLMPMRSVPHRVVCLLGLDDGDFPRRTARDGDDLILSDPHVGDRDPRAEDRQMLLDALLAARDRLVVTYTGKDERTNVERPPAVPVGELLDIVDETAVGPDGTAARDRVLVRHPLQPFDPRNFAPGRIAGSGPWSFDRATLAGAQALCAPRTPPPPFLPEPLPAPREPVVDLDDLVRFVEHPVRAFLRQRLRLSVGDYAEDVADGLPVELAPLERYAVGQRLLERVLAGTPLDDAIAAERARGSLPPGNLALPVIAELRRIVEQIAAQARAVTGEDFAAGSVDVTVTLAGGRRLSGTVAYGGGDVLRAVAYSKVAPKHRLAAWVRLLALTAVRPEQALHAVTVGRARQGARDFDVTVARIPPLGADPAARAAAAVAQLATLVDLRDRALREPLPLACLASAAYARAAKVGRDPADAARKQWESGFAHEGEDAQPAHRIAFGAALPFDDLLAQPPRDDERGPGWDESEATRFGRYARRLWAGLLEVEDVVDA